jgi:hypothetical protein
MNRRFFIALASFLPSVATLKSICAEKPIEGADLLWGTYGKSGKEPLKWKKLGECDTDHLQAILDTQPLTETYKTAIQNILQSREKTRPTKGVLSVLILALCLSGCGRVSYKDPETKAVNKERLSKNGEEIGALPDGRKVTRYEISTGKLPLGDDCPPHWIYVVEGSVSVNFETKEGKQIVNNVQVIVDEKNKER